MSKPIELELEPNELWTLSKWAHAYLQTDPKPLICPEAELALQLIEAHARYMTAALTGEDAAGVGIVHLDETACPHCKGDGKLTLVDTAGQRFMGNWCPKCLPSEMGRA